MKNGYEAGTAAKYTEHIVSGCEVELSDSSRERRAMRGGLSCLLAASFGGGTAVLSPPACKVGARLEGRE